MVKTPAIRETNNPPRRKPVSICGIILTKNPVKLVVVPKIPVNVALSFICLAYSPQSYKPDFCFCIYCKALSPNDVKENTKTISRWN